MKKKKKILTSIGRSKQQVAASKTKKIVVIGDSHSNVRNHLIAGMLNLEHKHTIFWKLSNWTSEALQSRMLTSLLEVQMLHSNTVQQEDSGS